MRDIFLLLVLPFLIYVMFKRPFIAVGLWVWTAMFFPNYWVYGSAGVIRYNLLFSLGTFVSYIAYKNKQVINFQGTGKLVLLFCVWALCSALFSSGLVELSLQYWVRLFKVILLFVFIILIIQKKIHFDFFLWCLVLSVGAYGALQGARYILSGGGHKIEGMIGHALGDRNELSLALVMLIPICIYFIRSYGSISKFIKFGFLVLILLLVLSVLGSNSRGGLISLLFLGGYFFTQSKNKFAYIITFSLLILIALQLVPDEWFSRMNTIENADKDASFMGRVVAWKLSTMLALENPIFGGGMKSLEYWPVWSHLSEQFHYGVLAWWTTGASVPDVVGRAAHSIYFQVLGEQGFVGLIIFLCIFASSIWRCNRLNKLENVPSWVKDLAQMLKLSILCYLIGGAALSFAYFDGIYAVVGLLIALENYVIKEYST